MKLRKVISLLTAAVMVAAAAACVSGCDSGNTAKYKIGICQLVQHEALDAATKGFKDYLKEKGL